VKLEEVRLCDTQRLGGVRMTRDDMEREESAPRLARMNRFRQELTWPPSLPYRARLSQERATFSGRKNTMNLLNHLGVLNVTAGVSVRDRDVRSRKESST